MDRLVRSKKDLATAADLAELERRLRQLNPSAPLLRAAPGADVLGLLTELRGLDLLRVKGLVALLEQPDRPLVVHVVQHLIHEPFPLAHWPSADRATRFVFITRHIPEAPVVQLWHALAGAPAAAQPESAVIAAASAT